jgi:hypothetical protein
MKKVTFRTKRNNINIVFWILLILFSIVGLLVIVNLLEYRYGPIDPTDPGWKVDIMNDLPKAIHIKNNAEDLTLQPGQHDIFVPAAPGEINPTYIIMDMNGHVMGCLTVNMDRKSTIQSRASLMHAC